MKGVISMAGRMTWKEIQEKYPDQWVAIEDATLINSASIETGVVKYTEKDMPLEEMILRSARGEVYAKYTTPDRLAAVGALTF